MLKFTPDGKVDRKGWNDAYDMSARCAEFAAALDECVAELRGQYEHHRTLGHVAACARMEKLFRKIGADKP